MNERQRENQGFYYCVEAIMGAIPASRENLLLEKFANEVKNSKKISWGAVYYTTKLDNGKNGLYFSFLGDINVLTKQNYDTGILNSYAEWRKSVGDLVSVEFNILDDTTSLPKDVKKAALINLARRKDIEQPPTLLWEGKLD